MGISSFAQPELNVPITPTTSEFCAYAFAFEVHLDESQLPFCAVESSHAWKPTVYLPAFQPCCASMYAIALFISVVSARFAPWSGRSDAMITFGSPLPPYWSFPHDDDGSGERPLFAD